jgi:hypothetical protein
MSPRYLARVKPHELLAKCFLNLCQNHLLMALATKDFKPALYCDSIELAQSALPKSIEDDLFLAGSCFGSDQLLLAGTARAARAVTAPHTLTPLRVLHRQVPSEPSRRPSARSRF